MSYSQLSCRNALCLVYYNNFDEIISDLKAGKVSIHYYLAEILFGLDCKAL